MGIFHRCQELEETWLSWHFKVRGFGKSGGLGFRVWVLRLGALGVWGFRILTVYRLGLRGFGHSGCLGISALQSLRLRLEACAVYGAKGEKRYVESRKTRAANSRTLNSTLRVIFIEQVGHGAQGCCHTSMQYHAIYGTTTPTHLWDPSNPKPLLNKLSTTTTVSGSSRRVNTAE